LQGAAIVGCLRDEQKVLVEKINSQQNKQLWQVQRRKSPSPWQEIKAGNRKTTSPIMWQELLVAGSGLLWAANDGRRTFSDSSDSWTVRVTAITTVVVSDEFSAVVR